MVVRSKDAAQKLAEVASIERAFVMGVEFSLQQRVENAERFGEVSRGYCSRHFVFGGMLVEVIIAGNHT